MTAVSAVAAGCLTVATLLGAALILSKLADRRIARIRAECAARRRHPSALRVALAVDLTQLPWCACGAPDSPGTHSANLCRRDNPPRVEGGDPALIGDEAEAWLKERS